MLVFWVPRTHILPVRKEGTGTQQTAINNWLFANTAKRHELWHCNKESNASTPRTWCRITEAQGVRLSGAFAREISRGRGAISESFFTTISRFHAQKTPQSSCLAVSQAVRTPSRMQNERNAPSGGLRCRRGCPPRKAINVCKLPRS